MQIDCEAITDPHSQLETPGTVVIASQGTQACGDELVVTGTSEGMPKGTQDTQAGSLKMVVTGAKRKAVELAASAGLPLVGRTESIKEAVLKLMLYPTHKEFWISLHTSTFRQLTQPNVRNELNF